MGPASAHEAAREAKLNRSSAYMLLATLVEQGFVEKTQQNGILKYHAVSPEKLVERADKLAQDSARQENEMSLLLSELLSVSKKLKSQPHVLFYEGVGGIQTVSNDLLAYPPGTQVYTFLPISKTTFGSSFSFWDNQNLQRKYKTKIIFPYEKTVERALLNANDASRVRSVPADIYPFSSELRIYADKIVFISTSEEFGVIIQSQDIADVIESLFNLAWEEAGRLDANETKKVEGE